MLWCCDAVKLEGALSLLTHPQLGILQEGDFLIWELMFSLHSPSSMILRMQCCCLREAFEVVICALSIRSFFHQGMCWSSQRSCIKTEQIVEILAPDRSMAKFPATLMEPRIHQRQGICNSNAFMLYLKLVYNLLEYLSLTNNLYRASECLTALNQSHLQVVIKDCT